jgi:ribosomal protein S18 acetylase RimI-like enzyme
MESIIRKVTIADTAALAALSKKTFYDTFTGTCTDADMQQFLADYFNETQVAKELSNQNDYYFFAEINGVPVGYLRFMEDYSSFSFMKQWKALELKRIYVLKEFQGKGIAQQLMNVVFDFCKKENYQVLWLGVWEHNIRAQKFYEKNGFVNSGHTHDFPIGNTPQTDYWFWKFL